MEHISFGAQQEHQDALHSRASVLLSGNAPVELVLCDSGLVGLAHIGVITALEELGIRIDRVTGMSGAGAVIAALYSNGVSSSDILQMFLRHPSGSACMFPGASACVPLEDDGLMYCPLPEILPLAAEFVANYGLTTKESLRLVAFDLLSKSPVVFEGGEYNLPLALAACCAMPGVNRPVRCESHVRHGAGNCCAERPQRPSSTVLVDCALANCRVEIDHFECAIVSQVATDRGMDELSVSPVDQWVHKRRLMSTAIANNSTPHNDHIVVETALSADTFCRQCHPAYTLGDIVDAGHAAALSTVGALVDVWCQRNA